MKTWQGLVVGCVALACLIGACAEGSELDTELPSGGGGGDSMGMGGNGSSSSSSGMAGGGGEGGGGGGEGGMGGGGPACDFTSPNTCSGAELLPEIDGDKGSDTRSAMGNTSKWFTIFVKEGVSSPIDYPALSFTASLQSPAKMDYDLFIYTGDFSNPDCGALPEKALGLPEAYSRQWGDTLATDDGTWYVLEVRHISGDICDNSAMWTLTVTGHTIP